MIQVVVMIYLFGLGLVTGSVVCGLGSERGEGRHWLFGALPGVAICLFALVLKMLT